VAAPTPVFSFAGVGDALPSPIAVHEAGHMIVSRFLGLPIGGATIVASADFGGLCFSPDTDPNKVTATALREEAESRCNDAMTLLPLPGERRDCTASWLVHAQSLVMESMAGFAAEFLAGFDRELEAGSTDYSVAKLYARSIVMSDEAVEGLLASGRADATQILKNHWDSVEAVALALDEKQTLSGVEIDTIIMEAEQRAVMLAEKQRRARMAKAAKHAKTFNRLREVLQYDPDTGIFTRLVSTSNSVRAGDVAGNIDPAGYRRIKIDGKTYHAHRLAFLYMTGIWPPHDIDHANMDRADNRWCNLRYASRSQNKANMRARQGNTSGSKGVCWKMSHRKWMATICIDGKRHHLGYRDTKEEAAALYAAAAEQHFGEFARTK